MVSPLAGFRKTLDGRRWTGDIGRETLDGRHWTGDVGRETLYQINLLVQQIFTSPNPSLVRRGARESHRYKGDAAGRVGLIHGRERTPIPLKESDIHCRGSAPVPTLGPGQPRGNCPYSDPGFLTDHSTISPDNELALRRQGG